MRIRFSEVQTTQLTIENLGGAANDIVDYIRVSLAKPKKRLFPMLHDLTRRNSHS